MKQKININLINALSVEKFRTAHKILSDNLNDIDIFYKNGLIFELAIDYDRLDIIKLLLESATLNNIDTSTLNIKLLSITEDVDLSLAMQKLLSPYIGDVESEEEQFDDQDPIDHLDPKTHDFTSTASHSPEKESKDLSGKDEISDSY